MSRKLSKLLSNQSGVTLVEYSMLIATVSLVVIVAMGAVGTNISTMLGKLASAMANYT